MRAPKSAAILLATAAIAAAVLWWQAQRPAPPASAPVANLRADDAPAATGIHREPVADEPDATAAAQAPGNAARLGGADPARIAAIERSMIAAFHRGTRQRMVERFIAQGLAPSDAEAIVAEALQGYAACTLDALYAQAEQESVSFDDLLYAVEAILAGADVSLTEMVDIRELRTRATPCLLGVGQQAGFVFR